MNGVFGADLHTGAALHAVVEPGGNGFVVHDLINLTWTIIGTYAVTFASLHIEIDGHVVKLPGVDRHGITFGEGQDLDLSI